MSEARHERDAAADVRGAGEEEAMNTVSPSVGPDGQLDGFDVRLPCERCGDQKCCHRQGWWCPLGPGDTEETVIQSIREEQAAMQAQWPCERSA